MGFDTGSARHTGQKPRNVTAAFYVKDMSSTRELESGTNCLLCEKDLRHCHGTAIMDDHGAHVCSDDPDCTLDISEHWFVAFDEISVPSQVAGVSRAS
jgi:hypothetical protein